MNFHPYVTNATLDMNQSAGQSAKASFLLTNEAPPCYVGMNNPFPDFYSQMMDQSQSLRTPKRFQDLTVVQRSLLELMHRHDFGRVENMRVRAGQPIFDCITKIVRATRLGNESAGTKTVQTGEFELKKQIRDLFEELERVQEGTIVRLEFRHGLPLLLETSAHDSFDSEAIAITS